MTDWDSVLNGCSAVISTLGGFGTNEQMEKLNGDANIIAVDAASKAGSDSNVEILTCRGSTIALSFVLDIRARSSILLYLDIYRLFSFSTSQ